MFSLLTVLFIVVPIIELYILIQIGQFIGALNTILLVIITGIVGAILAKYEGMRTWHNIENDLKDLKMPGDHLIDGLLILFGGIMLLTPGIVTDILGLLCIFPLSRPLFREILKRKFKRGIQKGSVKIINLRVK